jgi:nitrite reductase/ring-hydroxylating ferredoxin subunit
MGEYRYPFPPYPTGWYFVAESSALAPGDVVPMRWFGRDLVAFRTASGRAVVADAHCPHMGAHLGYGGTVEDERIRCPFHSWCFSADGPCVEVPYATQAVVPEVELHPWPVHETSGLILVHFDELDRAPTWWMPDRAEWGRPGWLGYETTSWRIRMHVQELAENIPDTAHFLFVHTVPAMPSAEVETDGHVYRQATIGRVDGREVWRTSQTAFGLGLVWLEVDGDVTYRFLTATTPIDEEHVELRLLFLVREDPCATEISAASRAAIEATMTNTARDVPIWEHKVYRERPPLVPGDGPIGVLRKWARQFYPQRVT